MIPSLIHGFSHLGNYQEDLLSLSSTQLDGVFVHGDIIKSASFFWFLLLDLISMVSFYSGFGLLSPAGTMLVVPHRQIVVYLVFVS